jgi:hypothetical protein
VLLWPLSPLVLLARHIRVLSGKRALVVGVVNRHAVFKVVLLLPTCCRRVLVELVVDVGLLVVRRLLVVLMVVGLLIGLVLILMVWLLVVWILLVCFYLLEVHFVLKPRIYSLLIHTSELPELLRSLVVLMDVFLVLDRLVI